MATSPYAVSRPDEQIADARSWHNARQARDVPQASITCRTIDREDDFYRLQAVWRELSSQTAVSSPFRSWDFTVEWYRTFVRGGMGGATGRFQVYIATAADQVVALVPLFEERTVVDRAGLGTGLRPFGQSNSFDPMTDEPIALFRKGYESIAARSVKAAIAAGTGMSGWDTAVIDDPSAAGAFTIRSIVANGVGRLTLSRLRPGPMALALPRSWDTLRRHLSKSMRDNLAHYPRKLGRDTGRWTLRTARSPGDVAEASEALISLHRRRGRSHVGVPHTDHIPTEAHADFLRAWFKRLAWKNRMSIVTVEIRGVTVAAQAFIEGSGSLAAYYSGFDDRWYRYSPLTIVMAAAIRDGISRNFARMDFPPVNAPWKARWGAVDRAPIPQTSIYCLSLPSLVRGTARRIVTVSRRRDGKVQA